MRDKSLRSGPAQVGLVAALKTIRTVFASFGLTTIRTTRCSKHRALVLAALLVGLCQAAGAQEAQRARPPAPTESAVTLFQNVRIFDGKNGTLSGPRNVVVRGNKI